MTWNECREFCKRTGLQLPTEAQWEYACRAGTSTPFAHGQSISTDQVNYNGVALVGLNVEWRGTTVPVDSFKPNAFGIHQMHGNVLEWCADLYHECFYSKPEAKGRDPFCASGDDSEVDWRVVRGGCYGSSARGCRSESRSHGLPDYAEWNGFRPVYNGSP